MVSNADTLPETGIPEGLGGKIEKAREVVLEALCRQSTHEGCAEELVGPRRAVQASCAGSQDKRSASRGGEARQRTERRPQSRCGRGCWATVEAGTSL